ncbi:MAG: hypothetical protein SGI77_25000 [Pirellulaceae bacterium]|nr:hypothetical protein [Pirellulaceae bacterium]
MKTDDIDYKSAKAWVATTYPVWDESKPIAEHPTQLLLEYCKADLDDSNESYRDLVKRTDYLLTFIGVFSVAIAQQFSTHSEGNGGKFFLVALGTAVIAFAAALWARCAVARPGPPDYRDQEKALFECDNAHEQKIWLGRQYYLAHAQWKAELEKLNKRIMISFGAIVAAFVFAVVALGMQLT